MILVGASAAGFAVLVIQGQLGPTVTIPARDLVARLAILAIALGSLFAYLGLLGAAVAVPMWTHRCYRNLVSLGGRRQLTPAWAAGSWFIPVINLVLPWIVLQDLWVGSGAPPRGRLLVGAWWVAWLAAVAAWVASDAMSPRSVGVTIPLHQALLACAGALLAAVIVVITRRQAAGIAAAVP